ncbi:MAG: NAD(P)H-hydrate epimerase [Gallintestinimicrobium sp.]
MEEQAGQLGLHPKRRVLIAAGGGNNGADGIAIGRLLLQEGYDVSFYLTSSEEKAGELLKLQLHAARLTAPLSVTQSRMENMILL